MKRRMTLVVEVECDDSIISDRYTAQSSNHNVLGEILRARIKIMLRGDKIYDRIEVVYLPVLLP